MLPKNYFPVLFFIGILLNGPICKLSLMIFPVIKLAKIFVYFY